MDGQRRKRTRRIRLLGRASEERLKARLEYLEPEYKAWVEEAREREAQREEQVARRRREIQAMAREISVQAIGTAAGTGVTAALGFFVAWAAGLIQVTGFSVVLAAVPAAFFIWMGIRAFRLASSMPASTVEARYIEEELVRRKVRRGNELTDRERWVYETIPFGYK